MQKFWEFLDGKKTAFAAIYWNLSTILTTIWFASGLPHPWDKINLTVGTILTIAGLGHKGLKAWNAGTPPVDKPV